MFKKALVFASFGVLAIACSATVTAPTLTDDGSAPVGDGGKPKEAAPGDDSATGACKAGDVSGFTATFTAPVTKLGSCSDIQAGAYVDCLFDNLPDAATCKTFTAAGGPNAACIACAGPGKAGPMLLETGNLVSLNNAGCIGVKDGDVTASGCASKVQASAQCSNAACDTNCPVEAVNADMSNQTTVDAELAALNACISGSVTGVCKTFGDAAACGDTEEADGGPAVDCTGDSSETFQDAAKRLTKIFCGGGAGPDAGPG